LRSGLSRRSHVSSRHGTDPLFATGHLLYADSESRLVLDRRLELAYQHWLTKVRAEKAARTKAAREAAAAAAAAAAQVAQEAQVEAQEAAQEAAQQAAQQAAEEAAAQQAAAQQAAEQAAAKSSSSSNVWYELRMCESNDDYSIDTGNGYYGAYQFALSTWYGLGFSGLPSDASPAVQDEAAQMLQERSGWGQWPACSAELGL
jgi:multidrug efflux pump subunit AcrA (membrane-fusion protein)